MIVGDTWGKVVAESCETGSVRNQQTLDSAIRADLSDRIEGQSVDFDFIPLAAEWETIRRPIFERRIHLLEIVAEIVQHAARLF